MRTSIVCAKCGRKLSVVRFNEAEGIEEVSPCSACLADASKEGFDEGHEEGYDEGYSQGVDSCER